MDNGQEDSSDYLILAEQAIDVAKTYGDLARKSPDNLDVFLSAAKYSRLSAKYFYFASRTTNDKFIRSVSLYNYHIWLSNSSMSLGWYFYYSQIQDRAIRFFKRVIDQHTIALSYFPSTSPDFNYISNEWLSKKIEMEAYIANCEAAIAWKNKKALLSKHYHEIAKTKWLQHKATNHFGLTEMQLDSIIDACDMKIETCMVMASAEANNIEEAKEHANLAVMAIRTALNKYPDWQLFREELENAVSLQRQIKEIISVSKVSNQLKTEFIATSTEIENLIHKMLAVEFENKVAAYFRDQLQYERVYCSYKPPYLKKEIAVFAQKGGDKTTITICECKLRLSKQPINQDELLKFYEKDSKVREYEQDKAQKEGRQVTLHLMFITNTELIEKEALVTAKNCKINVAQAKIPSKYHNLVSQRWRIQNLCPINETSL